MVTKRISSTTLVLVLSLAVVGQSQAFFGGLYTTLFGNAKNTSITALVVASAAGLAYWYWGKGENKQEKAFDLFKGEQASMPTNNSTQQQSMISSDPTVNRLAQEADALLANSEAPIPAIKRGPVSTQENAQEQTVLQVLQPEVIAKDNTNPTPEVVPAAPQSKVQQRAAAMDANGTAAYLDPLHQKPKEGSTAERVLNTRGGNTAQQYDPQARGKFSTKTAQATLLTGVAGQQLLAASKQAREEREARQNKQ